MNVPEPLPRYTAMDEEEERYFEEDETTALPENTPSQVPSPAEKATLASVGVELVEGGPQDISEANSEAISSSTSSKIWTAREKFVTKVALEAMDRMNEEIATQVVAEEDLEDTVWLEFQ